MVAAIGIGLTGGWPRSRPMRSGGRFSVAAVRGGAQAQISTVAIDGITDYTGKVRVDNLEPATAYSYAVTLEANGASL